MKTFCIILALLFIAGHAIAAPIEKQWSRIWGSTNWDYGLGVAVDQAGNSYVAGYTSGAFDGQTNTGMDDLCLTKYTADGTKQWTRIWGSATNDYGYGVAVDQAGNSYVAGFTLGAFDGQTNAGWSDLCLTKYSADGTKQWTRIWGSPSYDCAEDVAVDQATNIYVVGWTLGAFDGQTSAGWSDLCLTKYDAAGTKQWTRIWGSTAYDDGYGVAVDQAGNSYVAGCTEGAFDGQANAGAWDICLTKYNAGGTKQWTRIWGSFTAESGQDVAVDQAGNSYVAGFTLGAFDGQTNAGWSDLCLTKYSADGTKQWTRIWGSPSYDCAEDVAVDQATNIYVVGWTLGAFDGQTSTGWSDLCLTKYDADGTKQWTRIWGSAHYDVGAGVAVDQATNSYAAGHTLGAFDGQSNMGGYDLCLTKFGPVPFLDITNAPFIVELPLTTATIGGTNDEFIAVGSTMWWANTSTSGVAGTFVANATRAWTIEGIALEPDANNVTVSGSNVYGTIASDTIIITLIPEPVLALWMIAGWLARLLHLRHTFAANKCCKL